MLSKARVLFVILVVVLVTVGLLAVLSSAQAQTSATVLIANQSGANHAAALAIDSRPTSTATMTAPSLLAQNLTQTAFIPQFQTQRVQLTQTAFFRPPVTPMPLPSWTPQPSPTIDVDAFDYSKATTYKSPLNVLEIKLPKGWRISPTDSTQQPGQYEFTYGNPQAPSAAIQVAIDDPKTLYPSLLRTPTAPENIRDVLITFKANLAAQQLEVGEVQTVKIGGLDGFGMLVKVPAGQGGPASNVEVRLAETTEKRAVFVLMQGQTALWDRAFPVMVQMVENMVINAQAIPTVTPTLTPISLQMTQTALNQQLATLESQIDALTATASPTRTATPATTSTPTPSR